MNLCRPGIARIILSALLAAGSAEGAELRLEMTHRFAAEPLLADSLRVPLPSGETISFTRLSYLLSSFALESKDGIWVELPRQFAWMDAVRRRCSAGLTEVPAGEYRAIRFAVGLNAETNAANPAQYPAEHPLNPNLNGLHWSWQGGYIFMALEGHYCTGKDEPRGYSWHFARAVNRTVVTLPADLKIKSAAAITVSFDLAALLNAPRPLSMSRDGDSTHSRDGDVIAASLKANLANAFQVQRIETDALTVPPPAVKPLYLPAAFTAYPFRLSGTFPIPPLPRDNPLLEERIALGRRLFHEPLLSRNGALSCASCHNAAHGFSDRRPTGLATSDVGWLLALAALALGIVTIAIVARAVLRRGRLGTTLVAVVLVLFAAERLLFAHGERLSSGALGTYEDAMATTPGQAFILSQGTPEQNRVLTIGDAGDRMGAVGLFQADGYQAIYPFGVHDLFGALIAPQLADDPGLYRYFWSWGVRAYAFGSKLDPEVADLFGIRWIYVRDAAPPRDGYVERFRDGDVVVYENADQLPRAFVVGAVEERATRMELVDAIGGASRDELASTAWFLAGDLAAALPSGASSTRSADITSYSPDRVDLSVQDGPAGILVVTEAFGPGWVATVDDVATPVAQVDLAFRGIAVPAGHHHVVLRYVPVATYVGLVVAALAAVATVGGALLIRRRDRRRGDAAFGYAADMDEASAPTGRT